MGAVEAERHIFGLVLVYRSWIGVFCFCYGSTRHSTWGVGLYGRRDSQLHASLNAN
jgi:hypothetical protein